MYFRQLKNKGNFIYSKLHKKRTNQGRFKKDIKEQKNDDNKISYKRGSKEIADNKISSNAKPNKFSLLSIFINPGPLLT
jgi:hypothetical protein